MPDYPTVAELRHRIEHERHDVNHYGRHALESTPPADPITTQRHQAAGTMHLLSGDAFTPLAGSEFGKTA